MTKYSSIIEYYREKAHLIRDEAERIADDCFTKELQRLETSSLCKNQKRDFKHFNRSARGELFSIRLHLAMIQMYLIDLNWWSVTHPQPPTYNQICHMIEAYDTSIKRGFLIGIFAQLEHCFRHVARKLNGKETNKLDFWKIRDLLTDLFPGDRAQFFKNMLGLFANIRNTIHNDGLFYPKHGKDVVLEYRDNKYIFKANEAINFVNWELLLIITEDIANLFKELSLIQQVEDAYNRSI